MINGRPASAVVVNETLYRLLDKDAKIGEYCRPIHSIIIGVVKDYHFANLYDKILPQEHVLVTNYFQYFLFKLREGQIQQTIAKLEQEWKSTTANRPFEYSFLDQQISTMYKSQKRCRLV